MTVGRGPNYLHIGSLSLGPGYKWVKTSHRHSFVISGDDVDCSSSAEDDKEEYTYRIYCQGACDLGRSWELKERIDDQMRLAGANKGRMTFLWRENGAKLRREIIGGSCQEVQFELQRTHRQTIALDVTVELQNSLLLDPQFPSSIGSPWCDNDIEIFYAMLVGTGSSVLTEGPLNNPADYSNLDEFDGSGYARSLVTNRKCAAPIYSADDISFPDLEAGTEPIGALVIYRQFGAGDADNLITGVIPYTFWGGDPIMPTGDTLTFRTNALGVFNTDVRPWTP